MKQKNILLSMISSIFIMSSLIFSAQAQENMAHDTENISTEQRSSHFEFWQFIRSDIPIANPEGTLSWFIPDKLQTFTLARVGTRYQGPGPGIMRYSAGPIWNLGPHFSTGLLGEFIYLSPDGKTDKREYRIVPEISVKGKLGDQLGWHNRNWLEYRIFPTSNSFRYRNMARLNWKLNQQWTPFLSNEIFYDFNKGFNQNRARIGIGYTFQPGTRLDIGYMALHRKDGQGWYLDHGLTLFLYFMPQGNK